MSEDTDFTWTHLLYRFYGDDGALLYIGRTNDMKNRFTRHSRTQPWWSEVTRSTIETFADLASLCAGEKAAIIAEQPKYNVVYNNRPGSTELDYQPDPWLLVSARVTAGADALHDECRRAYKANYPDECPALSPPCWCCAEEAIAVLRAADAAAGHIDETIDAAEDALEAHVNASMAEAEAATGGLIAGRYVRSRSRQGTS